jgi:hypothetical protein
MTRFEDQLWSDLLADHGDDLAQERTATAVRGRRRPVVLTAGTLGLAGAATAVALTLTATTGAVAAYAVTANPNGTVTITINDLVGIKGANEQLAKLGVPIRAVPITADCKAPSPSSHHAARPGVRPPSPVGPPQAGGPGTIEITGGPGQVVIDPKQIPKGATMVLAASKSSNSVQLAGAVQPGPAPTCLGVPPSPQLPPGAQSPQFPQGADSGRPGTAPGAESSGAPAPPTR